MEGKLAIILSIPFRGDDRVLFLRANLPGSGLESVLWHRNRTEKKPQQMLHLSNLKYPKKLPILTPMSQRQGSYG